MCGVHFYVHMVCKSVYMSPGIYMPWYMLRSGDNLQSWSLLSTFLFASGCTRPCGRWEPDLGPLQDLVSHLSSSKCGVLKYAFQCSKYLVYFLKITNLHSRLENKIHLKAVSGLIKPQVEEDKSQLQKLNIFEKITQEAT